MSEEKKKHPGGRPTDYRPEYNEQVYKLCLLGADDKRIADFFGVSESTINRWKVEYPEFRESLKDGKEIADSVIASSLYHRAKGYSHKAVKIFNDQGRALEVEYEEQYPPDTTAAIFWLKNRQPKYWRDKQEVDHQSSDGSMTPKESKPLDAETIKAIAKTLNEEC